MPAMTKKLILFFVALLITFSLAAQLTIIPRPSEIKLSEGEFTLGDNTVIFTNEKNNSNVQYMREFLASATKYDFKIVTRAPQSDYIMLDVNSEYEIAPEGYTLSVTVNGAVISASSEAGIFYGIQTLFQMLPPAIYSGRPTGHECWTLPFAVIKDQPRFGYRGMMLDVSRTFFDAETVKRYIDWMAHHKINKFHWHLTDDNGWRIEIKKYPKLTEQGAWRGPGEVLNAAFGSGNKRYGGFYTQKQITEIVNYAAVRHIEVIPEIDLPGHSKAVTATYPHVGCDTDNGGLSVQGEDMNVWCIGKENNFKMLENIIKEVASLFPSKNIHIGGDEVNYDQWAACPHCNSLMEKEGMTEYEELLNYFVRRMETIVEKQGKHMSGWDEILDGGNLNPNTRVYAWRSVEKGIEAVTKGQPTIMMPGPFCYFDMKQSPVERGHNWAGIVTLEKSYSLDPIGTAQLTEEQAKLIVGVQAALWTELLGWPPRFMEYQTYPRLAAIAEVGWSKAENKEWEDFYHRLTSAHFDRLYQMGIAFRVPPPTVKYENGKISSVSPYPWAVVRYTSDESEPTHLSPLFKGDIYTDKPQEFRFATFFRDELKSVSVMPENASYTYLKPNITIETSIEENPRFPVKNLKDHNFNTYFRSNSKIKAGDYLTYIFEDPVNSKRITVETGIPKISFYGVTDGYAEYSYDGVNYIKASPFVRGLVVIYPEKPVKSVRIVATAPNDGHILSLQSLRIE